MDSCSSCHRPLNGALVCPGCGAYAPDIAPPGYHAAPGIVTTPEPRRRRESVPELDGVTARPGTAPAALEPPGDTTLTATPGRAARRHELARKRKQRRRAAVVSAVALVGGGLTLASLPSGHSTGHARTSSAAEPEESPGTWQDTSPAAAPSAQPHTRDAREPGAVAHEPATGRPARNAAPDVATSIWENVPATAATHGTAAQAPPPRTAPGPARATPATRAPVHATTPPPPPSSPSDSSTPQTPTASPASSSEAHERFCLLVLCLD